MSYQKEAEDVVITLTEEEYAELLLLLGFASARAVQTAGWDPKRVLRLLNSINAGNPNWQPYDENGRRQP